MKNKSETRPISALAYKELIELMFPDAPKTVICKALHITRPAHYFRLENGVTRPQDARELRSRLREYVEEQKERTALITNYIKTF